MSEVEIRQALERSIKAHGLSDVITIIVSQKLDEVVSSNQLSIYKEYKKRTSKNEGSTS